MYLLFYHNDSLGLSSHFYADDSQLYTWGQTSSDGLQRRRMELGVEQIAEWMRSNRLQWRRQKCVMEGVSEKFFELL